MNRSIFFTLGVLVGSLLLGMGAMPPAQAQSTDGLVPRFDRPASGLVLERPTQAGAFFDVTGRRAAIFGYAHQPFEAWVYPLKILSDFRLDFFIEGYSPLPVHGLDAMTRIAVRPEATTITYTHAAFTVRQTLFAPIEAPGLIMLLDVDSTRPLQIRASFRPNLRLMWPAGLMTANVGWNADAHRYTLSVEREGFAAVVGAPGARDVSMMPYQEEPRDVPARFMLRADPSVTDDYLLPIVIAGSMEGVADAQATYERLLKNVPERYAETAAHYRTLLNGTLQIDTPDERLDTAFAWAKVGMDKGFVTNPMLGTGLVAGYRTSGASERPGFAWFFGRDALWTAFALNAIGDTQGVRTALDFLKQFQKANGRIPHEISQSAALIPWFEEYPYPWASADATPLYIIAHAALWQATGDRAYLKQNWPSIQQAYQFTAGTDTDGDHLVENIDVGHGWVEGGALYPAQEEIYMQGLWVEAARSLAAMAETMGEDALAAEARQTAEATRAATEATYWLAESGFYAFATAPPLGNEALIRENTVLPAVPMWWRVLDDARTQSALDFIGRGALATDWGARILSARSAKYDPLSYHNGSVWPLFTGWASMGAYQYGRPHIGEQALMANALLTRQDALGFVTELLSGDYNTAFGRSSHHQIWSEAMVVAPAVQGLLGLSVQEAGGTLRFAPQLPADWDSVRVENVRAGGATYAVRLHRTRGRLQVTVTPRSESGARPRLEIAPAFPLDAQIQSATVNGASAPVDVQRRGSRQFAQVGVASGTGAVTIGYRYVPGTAVYHTIEAPRQGATNQGLRVLRDRATADTLHLVVEGRGGQSYTLHVRTPHRVGAAEGVTVTPTEGGARLRIAFPDALTPYTRRTLHLPLQQP